MSSNLTRAERRAVRGAEKRRDSLLVLSERVVFLLTACRREARREESDKALTAVLAVARDCGVSLSAEKRPEFLGDDFALVREGPRAFA